jgi:hypothetical protein
MKMDYSEWNCIFGALKKTKTDAFYSTISRICFGVSQRTKASA